MNTGVIIRSILHLKPSMVYWRVHRTLKTAWLSMLERTGIARFVFKPGDPPEHGDIPLLSSRYHCERIEPGNGVFTFLNHTVELPADESQRRNAVAEQPLLWQFHYGYHDYLVALLQEREDDTTLKAEILDFMRQWASDYPLWQRGARGSAWHAYVISLRIEAWIRLSRVFPAEEFIPRHIYQMVRVLRRNMEFGTMANHLLKNIKAVVLAGLYFHGNTGKRLLDYGLPLLERELAEQVLEDGMHFERSPMYHVAMTSDVLDLHDALGDSAPSRLREAAGNMTSFLRRILHPDGEVPFFNDSTSSFFLNTSEVLHRGEKLGNTSDAPVPATTALNPGRISGLLVHRDETFHLVFDGGNIGPDYQPGHAHCDTLSFELSVNGRRFITDTGVFHYKESPEREWARCTAAHNTIKIDRTEQSEIWKSFRVGRRAKILRLDEKRSGGLTVFNAAHDGYNHIARGLIHERFIVVSPGDWITVVDMLHGALNHDIESNVHLAPGVEVKDATEGLEFRMHGRTMRLHQKGWYSTLPPRVHSTEYYPAFGKKVMRSSATWSGKQTFPAAGGYILQFGNFAPRLEFSLNPMQFRILDASGTLYESSSGLA